MRRTEFSAATLPARCMELLLHRVSTFTVLHFQLSVRGKNNKERISGFFKTVSQSVDEVLLSNQKDKDDFFEGQKTFLVEYFNRIKDCTAKADRMTKSHKSWFQLQYFHLDVLIF